MATIDLTATETRLRHWNDCYRTLSGSDHGSSNNTIRRSLSLPRAHPWLASLSPTTATVTALLASTAPSSPPSILLLCVCVTSVRMKEGRRWRLGEGARISVCVCVTKLGLE
ncbi:uncharacterized protein DS421_8g228790 [Arachis hypogaea]|nr:uncharacterized protein DS421_8g228790 [Arachis hypogaea]